MMFRLAVILSACIAAGTVSGDTARSPDDENRAGRPVLELEPGDVDFGAVYEDQVVRQDILLHNTGDHELVISDVAVSCKRCLDTMLEQDRVPPGGIIVLTVRFDPHGLDGAVQQYVVLRTNDPEMPNVGIEVVALVSPRFGVQGGPVFFQNAQAQGTQMWEVVVYSYEPLRAPLSKAESDHPAFEAKVFPGRAADGVRVLISTIPPVPEGLTSARISLSSVDAADPACVIPVAANVIPSFYCYPSGLVYDARDAEQLRILFIDQRGDSGIRLEDVQVPLPGFVYEVFQGTTPFNYRINVYATGLGGSVGDLGQVVLRTDSEDERYREIHVPVSVSAEPLVPLLEPRPCYNVP